jgi:hypothetical protein
MFSRISEMRGGCRGALSRRRILKVMFTLYSKCLIRDGVNWQNMIQKILL